DALPAGGLEDTCLGLGKDITQVGELHSETKVGLVDAKAVHGFVPRDARDRIRTYAGDGLGRVEDRVIGEREDIVLIDEARFEVELHELVLPVGAQVFVAKTTSD